jgi:hypothetical protein
MESAALPAEVATRPAALVLLFALNVGDILTTRTVLRLGGREANPLSAQVLHYGTHGLLMIKLLLITAIVVAAVCTPLQKTSIRTARWLWWGVTVYGTVVIWNCAQVFMAQW